MDLRIVVAAHKPYAMPSDPAYVPLQVGALGKPPIVNEQGREFLRDDTGDNISAKNPSWCEMTGVYWAWKNLKSDAVGLAHYRRHFKGRGGSIATGDEIRAILEGTDGNPPVDIVLPKKRNYFIESTYSQYAHAHHAKDLDLTREVLSELDPESVVHFDAAMKSTRGHRFNMFVMRRALFDDYCAWIFPILEALEDRLDTTGYSQYDLRVYGFLAERLLDVWIARRGVKYAERPVLHLEGQNWPRKILSFLTRKFIRRRA